MKGLILSGGKGTRLRPITHTAAKQLVPVANKPILFYAIEALREAGIRDIGIIVGDTHEEVRRAVGDGSRWDARITYIQQEAPLGLAHAVKIAEDFMAGEPFLMYLGDNLIRHGVSKFVEKFERERPDSMILLAKVPNPQAYGIAELGADGRIVRLVEKPQQPASDLAIVGVYLFTSCVFEATKAIQPSARGELEITDAIQYLVDAGRVVLPHLVTGWWKDTGRLEDMLEANRIVLDDLPPSNEPAWPTANVDCQIQGRVQIAPTAILRDVVVRGPAIVGEHAYVEGGFIGPYTSIGEQVNLSHVEIEHSIVLDGTAIRGPGPRIIDSLIGRQCHIDLDDRHVPQGQRLMLGDHSSVCLA